MEGVRRCETSLEEVLGEGLGPAVGASDLKFLASGREDVDVRRMLYRASENMTDQYR